MDEVRRGLLEVSHTFETRIAYADTDRMGVVYYGNYFTLFERGRTELMRNVGVRYRDLEEKEQVFLPAAEASCRYLSPAHYDDLIRIVTTITKLGGASIKFGYKISNAETGKIVAEGMTLHPFVDKTWKPVRVPSSIRQRLQ
jgi:acyl-CoA thioester hydrolase